MLLKSFLCCLGASSFVFSAPVHHKDAELVHSTATSESYSISNATNMLQNELESIMMVKHLDNSSASEEDLQEDVLVIPRHHINEKVMNGLGLKHIIKHAKKFKMSNQAFDAQLEIMVPEKTKPLFLFNTTDPLKIPLQKTRTEYASFIDHAIPFELPEFTSLIDYYLVLPVPTGFDKKLLHENDIILTSRFKLPIFKHSLEESDPLLVFMFRSGNSVFEAKEYNIPLMKVKNYMGNQDLNLFFDIFAQNWISSVGYSHLIHSVFCTLNIEAATQSYCIKIKEDMNNLVLFPAFNGLKKHIKRDRLTERDTAFSSKTSTQRTNEDSNFPELTLPLSIIKDNDEESATSVDTYTPRAKGYSQVVTKLKTIKHKLQGRDAGVVDKHYEASKVEQLKNEIEHRLKLKKDKKKDKSDSNTFVISKASKDDERELTKSGKRIKKLFKTKASKEPASEEEQKMIQKQTKDTIKEIKSYATTAATKEQLKEKTGNVVEECVPITWVNVFHQSIFGKQKFCGM